LVTVDSVFKSFSYQLREAIKLCAYLDGGRQTHPEAIFFEMSARGLLAEYYADEGHYMKAIGEAGKAYDLVKKGFELSNEIPEFLLTTGVYNYFREKYPEKHPAFKPLLWFFRGGDVKLGLQQIDEATQKAVLTNVEAHVYMSYIYLRYEFEPEKARKYLWSLTKTYPNNPYMKAKLLEAHAKADDIRLVDIDMIKYLKTYERSYYQMAGRSFMGLHLEKVAQDDDKAMMSYASAISMGKALPDHGEYYRDLSHLGLARIYFRMSDKKNATYHAEQIVEFSESEYFISEAEKLLALMQ